VLNSFKIFLISLLEQILVSYDNSIESAREVLVKGWLDLWDGVLLFSEKLEPFCYTIIAICLLIELAQIAMKVDLLKWEHGLKIGVKMVLSKVCIDVAPTVLKAIYTQAADWTYSLSDDYVKMGEIFQESEIKTLVQELSGWGEVLGVFLIMVLVLIIITFAGLAVQIIAYGRIIEIYVLLVVSPIACAFFPLGDGSGGGVSRITSKYFKTFAAVSLQSVFMILCLRIFGMVMESSILEVLAKIAEDAGKEPPVPHSAQIIKLATTMLLGSIVLVMSVVKSGTWAKNLLDAM